EGEEDKGEKEGLERALEGEGEGVRVGEVEVRLGEVKDRMVKKKQGVLKEA
ncbi:hypothetical protein A2U01_0053041, partial [Trifolium medium]|nr:hypothetical protein [Trifolium medium]